jgi:NAD(P)-dependent dehydrogenase (short-subunit alcohol dehydrogenase family)
MRALEGKIALITGASRELGASTARAMAAQGANAMPLARDGATVASVAKDIVRAGGRADSRPCDVSDYAAVERAIAITHEKFGSIDFLLNNAGAIEPISEIAASDPTIWAENIRINLVGAYHVVRAVLGGMLAGRSGTIINVSSGAAHRPLEGWSAYCSGKAELFMLTRSIALETASRNLRALGFSPGTIDTEMHVKIRASGINAICKIPRAELSPVNHAVRGLVYLCSDACDDQIRQDVSMRDAIFRHRIGLA